MKRTRTRLSQQVKESLKLKPEIDTSTAVVSTGSTLLDLAISAGRFEFGGIPGGILVEVFGPAGCGKTMLMCEVAGYVLRSGGSVEFKDPEARLNAQFAKLFDFDIDEKRVGYSTPSTIPDVFRPVRDWVPEFDGVNAVFTDSLAALTTEMEQEDNDKYGMRRAKEFSEQCRLTCRHIKEHGILMVCSNQVRMNIAAGPYEPKYSSPGGRAIGFYCSLRLRCGTPRKIKRKIKFRGKVVEKTVGVQVRIDIHKSSVWEPHHFAEVYLMYDYGIDDIRGNLKFLKQNTGHSLYSTTADVSTGTDLGGSIEKAIIRVEDGDLEKELKQGVVGLWHEIEDRFAVSRKPKIREW